MRTKYNYELINDYLDGLLDNKTSIEISELIKSDDIAKDMARGILILREEFNDTSDVDEYLDGRLKRAKANMESKSKVSWLKIAASVILVATLGLLINRALQPSIDSFVEKEASMHYDYQAITRSGEKTLTFEEAMKRYSQKDYEMAVQELYETNNPIAHFYRGVSLIQLKRYSEAITELKHDELIKTRYKEQAEWYAILALVKMENSEEAQKLLTNKLASGSTYKYQEAKILLKLLSE